MPLSRVKQREDVFYRLFKEFSTKILEAGETYSKLVHDYPDSAYQISLLKDYEVAGDNCVRSIFTELNTSFITPFDREDISELALALDDIVDGMNGVVRRFDLFNVHEIREESAQMAELTVRCVHEVRAAIELLPDYKKDERVMQHAIMVSAIEDEGDTVYENALRRLFLDEENGRTTTAWLRLFDRMESVFDACDHVACIVRSVVMKSA